MEKPARGKIVNLKALSSVLLILVFLAAAERKRAREGRNGNLGQG